MVFIVISLKRDFITGYNSIHKTLDTSFFLRCIVRDLIIFYMYYIFIFIYLSHYIY